MGAALAEEAARSGTNAMSGMRAKAVPRACRDRRDRVMKPRFHEQSHDFFSQGSRWSRPPAA
jgi:hypothetical protein